MESKYRVPIFVAVERLQEASQTSKPEASRPVMSSSLRPACCDASCNLSTATKIGTRYLFSMISSFLWLVAVD